jgi:hypothetical protein
MIDQAINERFCTALNIKSLTRHRLFNLKKSTFGHPLSVFCAFDPLRYPKTLQIVTRFPGRRSEGCSDEETVGPGGRG